MRARTLLLFGFLSAVACRPSTRPADSAAASDSAVLARTWGLAYLQSNQLPQAETEFRKVIALAPEQSLGYADLGLVYLRAGRYGEAAAQLDRAAQLDSANSDVGLMRAEVYEQTGRAGEARQEIELVLRRDSTDLRALYALAQLPGQDHEALVRKIVARAPANLVARLELVDLLLGRGAAGDAAGELEALQRQLPQLPREGARFFERALHAARAGRAPEAATQAKLFRHAMEVTAAYQVSLQRLGGATGALVGYPILTFNQSMAVPTQDARAVAAAIRFTDVTAGSGLAVVAALPDSVARSLERGVALAAGDYDDDEIEDLYVAGHLFRGDRGRFVETTARAGVALRVRPTAAAFGDFDNDGRLDLIAGNLGLNFTYTTSPQSRFGVYAGNFTGDQTTDIVLTQEIGGTEYPFFGRAKLGPTIYPVALRFPSYTTFSTASVAQLFGVNSLQHALHYQTDTFASMYLQNNGNGTFTAAPLPNLAQISPIRGIDIDDVDGDGSLDPRVAGNLYDTEPNTTPADAGNGLWLKGDGRGHFTPVPAVASGFLATRDVTGLALIRTPAGKAVLVANSGDSLQAFTIRKR